jgi:hypothetical protein
LAGPYFVKKEQKAIDPDMAFNFNGFAMARKDRHNWLIAKDPKRG